MQVGSEQYTIKRSISVSTKWPATAHTEKINQINEVEYYIAEAAAYLDLLKAKGMCKRIALRASHLFWYV